MRFVLAILFSLFVQHGTAQEKNQHPLDSLPAAVYYWMDLKLQQEGDDWKRSVFKGSTTTLSSFEVAAYTKPPGKKAASFKHADLEELMIVKEGTFKITINKQSEIAGKGSVAFVMPGDEHAITSLPV